MWEERIVGRGEWEGWEEEAGWRMRVGGGGRERVEERRSEVERGK